MDETVLSKESHEYRWEIEFRCDAMRCNKERHVPYIVFNLQQQKKTYEKRSEMAHGEQHWHPSDTYSNKREDQNTPTVPQQTELSLSQYQIKSI